MNGTENVGDLDAAIRAAADAIERAAPFTPPPQPRKITSTEGEEIPVDDNIDDSAPWGHGNAQVTVTYLRAVRPHDDLFPTPQEQIRAQLDTGGER